MIKNYFSEHNLIIVLTIIISMIPIINIPFTWITVFFHEISHGIAAISTGGSVERISIHIIGSGLCYTVGGNQFIILQSGYLGAILWGVAIYNISNNVKPAHINLVVSFIICLIILSLLMWSRDIVTWIILSLLLSFFVIVIKLRSKSFIRIVIKFIGIYILLDAIKSPLYLIDGRHYGDGAKLSDLTHIPEFIWVIAWFSLGIWTLIWINKKNSNSSKNTS